MTTAKNEVFIVITWLFSRGEGGGGRWIKIQGIKIWGESTGGTFPGGGGMNRFLVGGGGLPASLLGEKTLLLKKKKK